MSTHPPSQPVKKAYGLWESPIQPALLSTRLRFTDIQWDRAGETLVWVEGRSGQGNLVSQLLGTAPRDLTSGQDVSGGVGYGGGEFCAGREAVFFAERDGRIYRRSYAYGTPRPITPAIGKAASPCLSPDEKWLLYVYTLDGQDGLASVLADGQRWPVQAAVGADFYMQPTWHPHGRRVAWVEWDHPNMPWFGSRLMLADFDPDSGRLVDQRMVAGGPDVPVFQPEFSPDGRWLSCILGENEEDVFCLIDLETGERQVLLQEVGLLPPAWVQGERSYAWGAAGQTIYLLRNQSGKSSLVRQALDGSEMETLDTRPYTWLKQLSVSAANESLACIASAPGISDQIITWEAGQIKVHRRSLPEMIDPADASQPQPIEWLAPTGSCVFGLYYPPCNPAYTSEGLPPAVVHIHGGPTSQHVMNFDPETGFFTSRGYAYLAVNYRGSTGYGRDYERLLNGHWGEYDVEDAVGSARAMADQGLADPGKIVIEGSSAGGYTVLNALIHHPGRFKAGVSSYGVADLFNLARDSHKFEAHYLDSLVGPLPETSARYHAWSPVNSLDKIRDPMAVFHGKQDKVVPPVQSENLVQALQARHIPHIYYAFDGEGHGFRKSTSLEVYYREVERFLQDWVIFG